MYATIYSLSGQITGMTKGGVYKFRLINGLNPQYSCDDTVAIKLVEPPVFSVDSYTPTCEGPTANNDGKIFITSFNNSDKYDIQKGGTYTGSLTFNLAKAIPADGVLLKNIPNSLTNDQYVVRLINQDNCYIDKNVLILSRVCSCVENICVEVKITIVKPK